MPKTESLTKWVPRTRKARYSTPDEAAFKEALILIRDIAFKHETQYWLDHEGTDAEKLKKVSLIARNYLNGLEVSNAHP